LDQARQDLLLQKHGNNHRNLATVSGSKRLSCLHAPRDTTQLGQRKGVADDVLGDILDALTSPA
jgi:hypothetical protein